MFLLLECLSGFIFKTRQQTFWRLLHCVIFFLHSVTPDPWICRCWNLFYFSILQRDDTSMSPSLTARCITCIILLSWFFNICLDGLSAFIFTKYQESLDVHYIVLSLHLHGLITDPWICLWWTSFVSVSLREIPLRCYFCYWYCKTLVSLLLFWFSKISPGGLSG